MTFKSIVFSGAALLALAACNNAGGAGGMSAAPTTDADKLKMAMEISTSMNGPEALDKMMDAMKGSMVPDMSAMCQMAPADQLESCKSTMAAQQAKMKPVMDEMIEKAKAILPDMQKDMAEVIAKKFSGAELARMKDFYASPEGKSIMSKLPDVMAEAQPKMMERLQPVIMETIQKGLGGMTPAAPPPT